MTKGRAGSSAGSLPGSAVRAAAAQSPQSIELQPADSRVAGVRLNKRCPACSGLYPEDFRVCPHDAQPLELESSDSDPLLGATLSDTYEIVRAIGEGGMGRVYEARHSRLPSKRYAIKVLHRELIHEPDVVTRFQREAEAASAVAHPNLVTVHDVNRSRDGRPFIVAEFLDGEDLGSFLDRVGKLDFAAAAHLVRQVCKALAAAHAGGVIHRDLKPENVFLCGTGVRPLIKVLDFGISKLTGSNQTLTKTGVVMGTPAYMAPEQARGDHVDERADVYSLGAILYRAVTGRKPFDGLDALATLTAVLVEEPPRPRSLESRLDPAAELIIQHAMAKLPGERYQTMAELEAALAPYDPGLFPAHAELRSTTTSAGADSEALLVRSEAHTEKQLNAPSRRPPPERSPAPTARAARLARPALAGLSVLAFTGALAALVDGIAGAVRLSNAAATTLTFGQLTLAVVAAAAVLLPWTVLWVRHLKQRVWNNGPRAVELARRLKQAVLIGAAAYGASALAIRVLEGVVRRDLAGVAWPGWSMLMFVVAGCVCAGAWFSRKIAG